MLLNAYGAQEQLLKKKFFKHKTNKKIIVYFIRGRNTGDKVILQVFKFNLMGIKLRTSLFP